MGSVPKENEPIPVNGNIYVLCGILKLVVASAAEAELGALFMNAKGYDSEHPFRRIIFVRIKGKKQSCWTLFYGIGPKRKRTNSSQR